MASLLFLEDHGPAMLLLHIPIPVSPYEVVGGSEEIMAGVSSW